MATATCLNKKKNIIITGYGPFRTITYNPTQEIVKRLKKDYDSKKENADYNMQSFVLEVSYDNVHDLFEKLKEDKEDIDLLIHLGVDAHRDGISLESQAFSHGYISKDVNECNATNNCNIHADILTEGKLVTSIPLSSVIQNVTPALKFDVSVSTDPGRFLCGYIYYSSLQFSKGKSVFIHVPNLNITSEQFDEMYSSVKACIDEIVNMC
uniref:Pyroglutamyl-peptidase I n=1 Tax=Rhabditophanes sp. KR3021 TaxID=114890 RepID=A0AC35TY61_9BILA